VKEIEGIFFLSEPRRKSIDSFDRIERWK